MKITNPNKFKKPIVSTIIPMNGNLKKTRKIPRMKHPPIYNT